MPCTICQHPRHQEIDQALIAGSDTLAALAKQYNLSTSALDRHKAHLRAKVGRAKAKLVDYLQQNCLFWLSQMLEMTLRTAQAAEAEGNGKLVLQAASQGSRLINIIMKHEMPLDDRLVYRIITSPQWVTQGSLWPEDPEIMAGQRQDLAETFIVPCPDTEADARPPISSEDLTAIQALVGSLNGPAAGQLKPENRLVAKREKSGKLPGKTVGKNNKYKGYQRDILNEKIFQKDADCTCSHHWLKDLDAGRLDIAALTAIGAGRPAPELFPEFSAAAPAAPGNVF
jgi:hypothetical protein